MSHSTGRTAAHLWSFPTPPSCLPALWPTAPSPWSLFWPALLCYSLSYQEGNISEVNLTPNLRAVRYHCSPLMGQVKVATQINKWGEGRLLTPPGPRRRCSTQDEDSNSRGSQWMGCLQPARLGQHWSEASC